MSNFIIQFGSVTNAGIIKEHNADAIVEFAFPNGHGFAVCDGQSGPQGHGALAARLTAEEIKKYFLNRTYKDFTEALTNAVSFANYSVYQLSLKDEKYKGFGSTVAVVLIYKNEVYYAYAGDSRVYYFNAGQLVPLTRDHLVNSDDPINSDLSVCIGRQKDIKFGVCKSPILIDGNERFLICSDGLTDWVTSDEILDVIQNNNLSPEYKAVQLVERANQAGGNDNVSVQIIEFTNMSANKSNGKSNSEKSSIWSVVAIFAILLLVVFIGYQGYKKLLNEGVSTQQNKTTESAVENMQSQNNNVTIGDEVVDEEVKTSDDETFISESQSEVSAENIDSTMVSGSVEDTIEANIRADQEVVTEQANEEVQEQAKPKIVQTRKPENDKNDQQIQEVQDNSSPFYMHQVEKGQNLFRIGLQYNVPMKKLEEINGEKASNLTIGEKLKIPVKALHKVASGETLYSLSKKYNTSIEDICKANKLDKNKGLILGNTLVIPLEK